MHIENLKLGGQTVFPDRSFFIGQKLVENAKIEKFKCDILVVFKQCEGIHFESNYLKVAY